MIKTTSVQEDNSLKSLQIFLHKNFNFDSQKLSWFMTLESLICANYEITPNVINQPF